MNWWPHFFHSWERVSAKKETVKAVYPQSTQGIEEEIVIVAERCRRCLKERAILKRMNGESKEIDMEFAKP